MEPIFLILLVPVALLVVFLFTRKDFQKNFANFDKLAIHLNTRAESSFLYSRSVQGWYKNRWVECRVAFANNFGTVQPDFSSSLPARIKNTKCCPIYLCSQIQPETKQKFPSFWTSLPKPVKMLTDYVCLFDDGRMYYTKCAVSDSAQKGYQTFSPKIISEEDKKSLWAFFATPLTDTEVRFFLDELVKGCEMIKK